MKRNDFDIVALFAGLLDRNRLAREEGFVLARVSGLGGFEEALDRFQSRRPLLCVSDSSDGYIDLSETPHVRSVSTIFIFMPHDASSMEARDSCLRKIRELFRQLVSGLNERKRDLSLNHVFIDRRIAFTEIDRYFNSSGACAYFQISVDTYTDTSFNEDEWL